MKEVLTFENIEWWHVTVFIAGLVLGKLWWENNKPAVRFSVPGAVKVSVRFSRREDELNAEINERIRSAKNAEDIVDILDEYGLSEKNEADLLAKALTLDLSTHDWVEIYLSAESETELEEIAEKRAGDALE
ncbi:hypothetical protein A2662_01865 [Candidatus Giovannonibacteria bacterium RIFCSPHIGHO2_01_FULL_45_33]|uniref:Uncharacterized protein n=1 Tax=Candidatus Giovannonibacteria bacterium RIFCSPLOWO2_01_FULL_45_34 TaxID=1798351 RepID=A0A1F5WZG6_9BACT|nr:MAG: hypothetical protein A2662_01865 [Candidatus Giovannonibacteria bacterium RIFCSPHIGHO2_01_FULL_45_33]OGF69046.1 MAG: hypothetical protein A3C73_00785 [Candidatus Giovannonibacteria bacterium RIFCSPHIGHO2_02_FULL_44_11]OGF81038.1 MAG: hypothetical protein A2930_03205 [Candidatus Giovannonibacteria bacterium RIFCSPLOWO2_01_FULL_45_34]